MKIKIGILKSRLETDNPNLIAALINKYKFKVPGGEWSTAYKQRRWDGRKSFINGIGVFKTGILPLILKDLEDIGANPQLEYTYDFRQEVGDYTIDGIDLYQFQDEIINTALEHRRGIIKSPTGSGKTVILGAMVKALLPRKIVILVNQKSHLHQTYEFLTNTCKLDNVGVCFGEGFQDGDIMISTVQSVERILDSYLHEAEVLMVDEVHEFCKGKNVLPAINTWPNAMFRYGFTATPPREDLYIHELIAAFGPVLTTRTAKELIDDQKLTPPVIQMIDYEADCGDLSTSGYSDIYTDFIIHNEERNGIISQIVAMIREKNKNSKIVILVQNLDHLRNLLDLIPDAYSIEGIDSVSDRYSNITKFRKSGKSEVLIGTKVLQTGINIEEITHLINARGLQSEIATLQGLGRALRKHDSKTEVYIYDFMDTGVDYLSRHAKKRMKHYKAEGYTVEKIKL